MYFLLMIKEKKMMKRQNKLIIFIILSVLMGHGLCLAEEEEKEKPPITVKVWVDKSHDGTNNSGEVYSLDRLSIESMNLKYVEMMEVDTYGNQTRERSTFIRKVKGISKPLLMIDVWFNTLVSGY